MIRKHTTDVPETPIEKEGFKGMVARYALTRDDGCPNYALRIMEFAPGGHTSLHAHAEEHEFYFLDDAIIVDGNSVETKLKAGDIVYVAPHEKHQLKNAGNSVMRVVCTIPILEGGDGKYTRQ